MLCSTRACWFGFWSVYILHIFILSCGQFILLFIFHVLFFWVVNLVVSTYAIQKTPVQNDNLSCFEWDTYLIRTHSLPVCFILAMILSVLFFVVGCSIGRCVVQSVAACRKGSNNKYEFKFDRVFSPDASQAEVFEEISQLVQVKAVFAYVILSAFQVHVLLVVGYVIVIIVVMK